MPEFRLGRYRSPMPVRCRGTLHFYSGLDYECNRRHLIVMAPQLPVREARLQLRSLARAHRLVAGGPVPGVAAEGIDEPAPWIALDCDAVADLEHLVDFVRQGGPKPALEQASAIGETLMETLIRCHEVNAPDTGRPVCLGSLADGNLLFASNGKLYLVGFGAGPLNGACIAPEVALGAPPTPGADVYALTVFLRARLEFAQTPSTFRRVFDGRSLVGDAKMLLLFLWSNRKILASPASKRPSMRMALVQARKMWHFFGFEPDVAGFAAYAARAIAMEPERLADMEEPQPTPRIILGREAEWLETPNGMRHSLATRGPLRRLLLALAEAQRDAAGAAVSVDELLQAGWPGENPVPEAGANRVYVAISSLRKLGLGTLLQRWDGGYRLDPSVLCHFKIL